MCALAKATRSNRIIKYALFIYLFIFIYLFMWSALTASALVRRLALIESSSIIYLLLFIYFMYVALTASDLAKATRSRCRALRAVSS